LIEPNAMQSSDAADLVVLEAAYLDNRSWDDWLGLFAQDCEFWMPAWKSQQELTSRPDAELSLIYYSSRDSLQDRLTRIRSGHSIASVVLPRTLHSITNFRVEPLEAADSVRVYSNWVVHQYNVREAETEILFGRYEHDIGKIDGHPRIRRKKIVILNDCLPSSLDIYSI
jgi:anthranilate 1,2-dioxygenase (deaminating, decarboxylating) small subunit